MSTGASKRKTPGPKKDERPSVSFKVEQDVYEKLAALQTETSLPPDLNAGMLLHMLIRDPATIAARLAVLLPQRPASEPPIDLAARKREAS